MRPYFLFPFEGAYRIKLFVFVRFTHAFCVSVPKYGLYIQLLEHKYCHLCLWKNDSDKQAVFIIFIIFAFEPSPKGADTVNKEYIYYKL